MTNQVKVKATPAERLMLGGITLLTVLSFFLPWMGYPFYFDYHDDLYRYLPELSRYLNVAEHQYEYHARVIIIFVIAIWPLILLTIISTCIPRARVLLRVSAMLVGICACMITLFTFLIAFASHHVDFFEEVGIFDGFYLTSLCGIALVALSAWKLFVAEGQSRKSSAR